MLPRAADRFDEILVRLFTVCDRRFETAPNFERWMLIVFMAVSILAVAVRALSPEVNDIAVVAGMVGT